MADDEAQAGGAAAAPLKEEADKALMYHAAAIKVAEGGWPKGQGRAIPPAGCQVASVMDSPDPPKPAGRIDEIVFAKPVVGIQPVLCSDAVFVRRAI